MTAITLQKRLIKKISEIDNIAILKSLETLIEEEKPKKLSELQIKLIAIGIKEIKEGKGISYENVMNELELKYGFV